MKACLALATLLLSLYPVVASAGCMAEVTDAEVFDRSAAVAEFSVVSAESFIAGNKTIRTRLVLSPVEVFKGKVPRKVEMTVPGGTIGARTDYGSDSLPLEAGKSYVLMMGKDALGNWTAGPMHTFRASRKSGEVVKFFRNRARGKRPAQATSSEAPAARGYDQGNSGIPGSLVTATGYSETADGHPTRFTLADSNEPIPYIIDIDPGQLPSGMNQAGAIAAVAEAVNAWAASSTLRFRYEGTQSFGVAASGISTSDRRLRIQLHDNFNAVNTVGVLGIGGGGFSVNATEFTGGTLGVQGFQQRLNGYVVMESVSNNALLQSAATFKRVLTHEIGHALGLTHSSENPSEPNAILKAATMYYSISSGSAGATVQEYDVDRIQFGYPLTGAPPVSTNRLLRIITASSLASLPQNVAGVNSIELRAFSKSGSLLTPVLVSSSSGSGTFSLSGTRLSFTPNAFYSLSKISEDAIEAGSSFGLAKIQFSDGVNISPVVACRVISLEPDTTPSDGLPDAWMTANFGSTAIGALNFGRHPDDDPDKDGLTNRIEFYLNTNPNLASSGPATPTYNHTTRQFTFTPTRFAPYWIESSTSLGDGSWTTRRMLTNFQASGNLVSDLSQETAPVREFYRVVTAP